MTELQQAHTDMQTQTTLQTAGNATRPFSLADIFKVADLDIYEQMTCIVLSTYQTGTALPPLGEIARKGRMTSKQSTHAIQNLGEKKILSPRISKQLLGDYGDDRLTWAAKGLLVYLKNNPQADVAELIELASQSGDDEHRVREALNELQRFGYLEDLMD